MNIVIKGAGFFNKGAEAMARTVQVELGRRLPDCEFVLWRPPQWDCRPALNSGFLTFQMPFENKNSFWCWPKGKRVSLRLWSLLELFRSWKIKDICGAFASGQCISKACDQYLSRNGVNFDALIDISGFAYGDAWGIGEFRHAEPLINYFRSNKRPIVFLPQAWGSFDNPKLRKALRRILENENTSYYSRDESSCRHLEKTLDKSPGSILVTPDIVFGFQGGSSTQGEHILRSMGCTLNRPIIGLAPNIRVYERVSGKGMGNTYLQALVKLVDYCHSHHDVDIVLQANEIALSENQMDDRYLCSLIFAAVRTPERCFMSRESLTAETTKALIGRFDYLIGSRFHSLVFGFSQGIPGMAVSWSHKYRELLSLFGLGDNVQECEDIAADPLIEMFEKGWADRKQHRSTINERARQLNNDVSILFDEVANKMIRVFSHTNA